MTLRFFYLILMFVVKIDFVNMLKMLKIDEYKVKLKVYNFIEMYKNNNNVDVGEVLYLVYGMVEKFNCSGVRYEE